MRRPLIIAGRNINTVFPEMVALFRSPELNSIIEVGSRGGRATLEYDGLVCTTYDKPCERVLFHPVRDANPFFHFFETLWILAGRNDVDYLKFFLESIKKFSDDGVTYHGAYGYRLRHHFPSAECQGEHDQLMWVVDHLREDPLSRRAVLTMHDPYVDHEMRSLDIPCNLALAFLQREGALHLTVFNRSNDAIWGAYGANVVQFSTILEYVAGKLGVPVGTYTQVSNSFHVYVDEPAWQRVRDCNVPFFDPYQTNMKLLSVTPYPMHQPGSFDLSLHRFIKYSHRVIKHGDPVPSDESEYPDEGPLNLTELHPYFASVAQPMFNAYWHYKEKNYEVAFKSLEHCQASDWKAACRQWLFRRPSIQTETIQRVNNVIQKASQ